MTKLDRKFDKITTTKDANSQQQASSDLGLQHLSIHLTLQLGIVKSNLLLAFLLIRLLFQ